MSKVILHISDLHFGLERGAEVTGLDKRELVLSHLIQYVKTLSEDWKPDIICISGDIGYGGKKEDYNKATKWIENLLGAVHLTPEDLIVCAGNHDVDRGVRGISYPHDANDADETLGLPIPEHILKKFEEYSIFCESFGIPPVEIHDWKNHLVGTRTIKGLQFVVLNSSWFCRGNHDKGNLWVGLPQVRALEVDGALMFGDRKSPCITIVHHPRDWLDESEHSSYAFTNRPATMDYLASRCSLILTGHTHGPNRPPDKIAASAWHVTAGATFDNAGHFNNFSLMQVSSEGFVLRQFEYDPRAINQPWAQRGNAEFYPFTGKEPPSSTTDSVNKNLSLSKAVIQDNVLKYALREQEKKSRAIKGIGNLPELTKRDVTVFLKHEHLMVGADQRLRPQHQEIRESFLSAVRRNSRTLLLGELGSGKSTLATQLVIELAQEDNIISFFIPAAGLKDCLFDTIANTLKVLSKFIMTQIITECSDFDLHELLINRNEVTIIIDGLDEIEPNKARLLLDRLSDMVHSWANLRIVATGRPIELLGFEYGQWQILGIPSLGEEEQLGIIYKEALSEGFPPLDAEQEARKRINILNKRKT